MSASPIDRLLAIMARLRDADAGCPWDREQTYATIVPHTVEEAYEVAEAIEAGDMAALKDELGDLLFQVVFYAQMAREDGIFDFHDVAATIADKMVRRHPHVFAGARIASADAQAVAWEAQKDRERAGKAANGRPPSVLNGVSVALPALTRAVKLQKRAARVGFDWPDARSVLPKIVEELDEVTAELAGGDAERLENEFGDLLFACVNLARKLNIDPEGALRRGNRKFERRFRCVEDGLAAAGKRPEDADIAEMEGLWNIAKRDE